LDALARRLDQATSPLFYSLEEFVDVAQVISRSVKIE
jgi:hypothetical protein